MTDNPDHDITMTAAETAALAPFLAELSADDLAYVLRHHRAMGRCVKAAGILRDAETVDAAVAALNAMWSDAAGR